MAAPPKPWERNIGLNQRQASFHPDQSNSFMSQPGIYNGGGGGGMSSGSRPPLPPRPTSYASNTMARPMYGGYNSYSSYGGYGGSPYGGYGSYGGAYGGYGGYNRYGMMGNMPPDENGFVQVAEESSRQAFQSIESIVHAFGSVSMMLESTYSAVHSSFRAVLGVADHFSRMKSHFAQIFSALAIIRTLRWILKKLLYLIGLRAQDPSLESAWRAGVNEAASSALLTEADLKSSRSSWPIVMFLGVVFGGPYLIWRLLSSLVPPTVPQKSHGWKKGVSTHYAAVALYNFEAGNKSELSFQVGQPLFLAPKEQQPQIRGWLYASNGTHVGIVPANYIKILGLRQGSPQPVNNLPRPMPNAFANVNNGKVAPRIPSMPVKEESMQSSSSGQASLPGSSGIQHPSSSGLFESSAPEQELEDGEAVGVSGIAEEDSSDSSYEEISQENVIEMEERKDGKT